MTVPLPRRPLWMPCWGGTRAPGAAGLLGTVSGLLLENVEGLVCERMGLPTIAAARLQQSPVLGSGWGGGDPGWGSAFPGGFLGR